MNRPVNIGLSPNLELDDVRLALRALVTGGDKNAKQKLVDWFEKYFPGFYAVPFNSGRTAEWAIVKALELKPGDEVLYDSFTCVAVPNSIVWAGATAVEKMSPKTKAVIVQHTFGQAAEMIKRPGMVVIEDCAHALGATYKGRKLGTFGDAAFFSLGRDKVVNSVFGGVAITRDTKLLIRLRKIEQELPENSGGWVNQQLLHPILTWVFLSVYDVGLGKLGLWGAQKLHLLSKAVYEIEKKGGRPGCFPAKYSNRLAQLGLHQLQKLERFNQHRREIAKIYFEELKGTELELPMWGAGDIYLRFTVRHPRARELYLRAKIEKKWVLGDWYRMSKEVLNLPTYIGFSEEQARELCKQLKIWLKVKK